MFVLFHLRTNMTGTDDDTVYEVDDSCTDENLDEIGYDLARDNAEMYGVDDYDEETEEEPFSYFWEKLDKPREEIEEEYRDITQM